MIRIVLALLLIIAVFVGLVLFPEITNQAVRIEIFGWLFETRTGMFILLLLFLFSTLWLIQKVLDLSVNSPKQLWSNLRSGNKKRREERLQEALATWIDEGDGSSQKLLKRSKGIVPDWLHDALLIWWDKPNAHAKINDEKDSPLSIALRARLATDPENRPLFSLSERQQYLDTWLAVHPAAPLAVQRKAELLGELGSYAEQVALFEELWEKKKNVTAIKPLFATALRCLAAQDENNKLAHLRKANRINPNDAGIIIDLASALQDAGDTQSASRLLLDYLEQHDDMNIAEKAFAVLSDEPLAHFRTVDKPNFKKTAAGNWLRSSLAHKAELVGIAEDGLTTLLENHPSAKLWLMRGDWFAEAGQWEKAAHAYKKAQSLN